LQGLELVPSVALSLNGASRLPAQHPFRHTRNFFLRFNSAVNPIPAIAAVARVINRRLLLAILLAVFIIGLTMSSAIRRGMDQAVMIGPGDQTAIAIRLSDSIYHVNLGYVGLKKVFDTIQSYWNRDASGWANIEKLKANFHDAELLNAGIRAAASLGPQDLGSIADGTLITTFYDDMGEVDYVTLAFLLFGPKVQSMFYLYFTLLGLSALIFILTFQDRIFALCLLFTTLFAYYVELYLMFFDQVAIPTYWGMRHSSTLCLVPMLHFTFLLLWKRKLSLWVGAGAVVQLAILILAWRIRGSVTWVMLFLPLVAITLAVWQLWPRSGKPWSRAWPAVGRRLASFTQSIMTVAGSWRMLVRRTLCWPLVLLLFGLVANNLYNRATLHPIYHSDDVMSYHGLWHPAHIGLALYAPDVLGPRVLDIIKTNGVNDGTTAWVARDYLDQIHLIPWDGRPDYSPPAPGWLSPWPGIGHKAAWHDRTLRDAYIEKLKTHPLRFLRLYASMPPEVVRILASPFTQAPTLAWLWLIAAAGAGVFLILLGLARNSEIGDGIQVLGVSAAAIATATLPNMMSYVAAYSMADSILMIMGFMAAAFGIGVYAILRCWRRRLWE
jgi:hypothetical protein